MKSVNSTPKTANLFPLESYEKRRGEIRLHMSHFFLKYLNDIYQAFDGDLAMAIILGEISHHNTARFFSPEQEINDSMRTMQTDQSQWDQMECCNAYSISSATGIPRETVRRKTAELKKRGWVEELSKQGLRITQTCADHFGADYSFRFLNGLLRASRKIEALLAEDADSSHETKPEPKKRNTPVVQRKTTQSINPPTQKKKP